VRPVVYGQFLVIFWHFCFYFCFISRSDLSRKDDSVRISRSCVQDHLISSQRFVFGLFLFLFVRQRQTNWSEDARTKSSCLFAPKVLVRDFCEVEFWEVLRFLEKYEGFVIGGYPKDHRLTAE
jgi:hypothetical protein